MALLSGLPIPRRPCWIIGISVQANGMKIEWRKCVGRVSKAWIGKLERDLRFSGFEPSLSVKGDKTVQTAWIRISGLLKKCFRSGTSCNPSYW